MKILLCTVPDGTLKFQKDRVPLIPRRKAEKLFSWQGKDNEMPTFPIGVMRILAAIQQRGYDGEIYDLNNLRQSDDEIIENFKKIKPDIVGLSGPLSHCYPNLKHLAKIIRNLFPDAWIIVGGHISGSSHILLNRTETDIVVVGDGEICFNKLLDYIKDNKDRKKINYSHLNSIKGLAFLDEHKKLNFTGYGDQIKGTEMEYPSFSKWEQGLKDYGGSDNLINEVFQDANDLGNIFGLNVEKQHKSSEMLKIHRSLKNKKVGRIQTSKGCVAKCTFCQRATKGYRVFGHNHMEARIIELKEKYNVGVLLVDDENFGSNRVQARECARLMKKHGIYWSSQGARAASINVEDLKFYKENNLLAIRYGIESGSQTILDIMEKKTTTHQVYEQIEACTRLGIATTSEAFMLGFPGESRKTVIETSEYNGQLRFLLGNSWNTHYPAWATSIPGTPLYEYTQQIGVVGTTLDEEEEYLYRTSDTMEDRGILNYLNKTEYDIKEVHYWLYLYRYVGKKAYVDEIIKKHKTLRRIASQIYHHCLKEAFIGYIHDYKRRINRKFGLKNNIKTFLQITAKYITATSVPFLPRFILLPLLKIMSDFSFKNLERRFKVKNGPQKYNFFVDRRAEKGIRKGYDFTKKNITDSSRIIDRSLRSIVKKEAEIINLPLSKEEKNIELIAKQQ
jgi:anaerobic magnesium-protoporphyrin IX monomethyl ester cyclase